MRRDVGIAVLLWAACGSIVWGEDKPDAKPVEVASVLLAQAIKTPPESDEDVTKVTKALRYLARHAPEGLTETAWTLARDTRQAAQVRGAGLKTLSRLTDSHPLEVGKFAREILADREQTKVLRMHATLVFHAERFATAETRDLLEEVLLRADDDSIVQRACLRALAETATLARMRMLLLRRELYQHAYYGIRHDVSNGLANLNVRDRRALVILCALMKDRDAADDKSIVPTDAWLSFWILTGRTHGIESKELFAKRPEPYKSDRQLLRNAFRFAYVRKGVSPTMYAFVRKFARPSPDLPNATGLTDAADRSKREFDAIEAEWRAEAKK